MNQPLLLEYPAWLVAFCIFLLILGFIWLGSAYRNIEIKRGKEISAGLSPVENSMLGLMALFMAFTFGMAMTKFESRRKGIIDESNAIEAVMLRCDLYPDSMRALLRADIAKYIDTRIAFNDAGADYGKIRPALDESSRTFRVLWKEVIDYSRTQTSPLLANQMLPSLTAVVNSATNREAERIAKVPPLILTALLILTFTGSFLIGFNQAAVKRSRIFIFGFALMTTIALYLILELERPWSGLINLSSTEQRIITLRGMLTEVPGVK